MKSVRSYIKMCESFGSCLVSLAPFELHLNPFFRVKFSCQLVSEKKKAEVIPTLSLCMCCPLTWRS